MSLDETVLRHHGVLRTVSADASMHPKGEYATVSRRDYFRTLPNGQAVPTPERRKLHEQWIAEVIEKHPNVQAGKRAVVMAGPPGAGKGYVQENKLEGLPGFIVCDPDKFKEKILEHEMQAGRLDELKPPLVRELESQGERFAPMEFASLVHEESSLLSSKLQDQLMQHEMNFVIDTVLKSEASAQVIASRLDNAGYKYSVVSVQTTEDVSKDSIRERWEKPYRKFLAGEQSLEGRMGGRPVPSEFATSVFPVKDGPSTTQGSALWLASNGTGVSSFQQFRRVEGKPHSLEKDMVKRDGNLISRQQDLLQKSFPQPRRGPSTGQRKGRDESGIGR